MKSTKLTRRRFLWATALASPFAAMADARFLEPQWLNIKRLNLAVGRPSQRLVHFTDLHHKGDARLLRSVVTTINSLAPDLVCFTGDIIEEGKFLPEALEILAGIKAPMFGVPGNHDYWSKASFAPIGQCFAATRGAWLVDAQRATADGKTNFIGVAQLGPKHPLPAAVPGMKNILLIHYPAWVKKLGTEKYDLILAGHSHGGQVRIPFFGPVMVPFGVDEFDLGFFQTANGPLYVNPGIGYIYDYHFRFNCRPEITVIEI